MTLLVNLLVPRFEIIYNADLLLIHVEDKKIKEELDEQLESAESGVSCDSCPIDSAIQKLFSLFRHKN